MKPQLCIFLKKPSLVVTGNCNWLLFGVGHDEFQYLVLLLRLFCLEAEISTPGPLQGTVITRMGISWADAVMLTERHYK